MIPVKPLVGISSQLSQNSFGDFSVAGPRIWNDLPWNCDTRISALDKLSTCWNRISLVSHGAAWLFDYCALEALLLIYLLTYNILGTEMN